MKRRDLIRAGVAAGAAGLVGVAPGVRAAERRDATALQRVRNVIMFAYDGLSWEDIGIAQWYARRTLGRPLTLQRLLQTANSGLMETWSLTSVITDSAAAATAWSSGSKVVNGMLNQLPDGTPLVPVLEIARAHGRATGFITTARLTHATPAAWLARTHDRTLEDRIAEQYLAFAPDVMLGGGSRHFLPDTRADRQDMAAAFAARGYSVVRSADELARSNASRLLGMFSHDHMPFEIDRVRQSAGGPSLAEMVRAGLPVLAGSGRGFVVQIEPARVDHANHKNDAAAALHDIMAADEALEVVLEFVARDPETLLIIGSDHGTGGGVAYGVGRFYRDSSDALVSLTQFQASFDHILALIRRGGNTEAAAYDVIRELTGITLTATQLGILRQALDGTARPGIGRAYLDQPANALGYVLYGGGGGTGGPNINFATGQHTAGPVPVAAMGPGAATLPASYCDNTDLHGWMMAALGSDHRNPVMSEQDARDALQAGRRGARAPLPAGNSATAAAAAGPAGGVIGAH
jgi:alkaline phosphatase